MDETAEHYRDFAKRCRAIARDAYAHSTRQSLIDIADEYDQKPKPWNDPTSLTAMHKVLKLRCTALADHSAR